MAEILPTSLLYISILLLSDEAWIRLDQNPNFYSLLGDFVGAISAAGTPSRAQLMLLLVLLPKGACSCGCEGMRVKRDLREAGVEETREAWQKRLPPPPCGLVLMLQSVPQSRHCELLHRQSKRSCPDSISVPVTNRLHWRALKPVHPLLKLEQRQYLPPLNPRVCL